MSTPTFRILIPRSDFDLQAVMVEVLRQRDERLKREADS